MLSGRSSEGRQLRGVLRCRSSPSAASSHASLPPDAETAPAQEVWCGSSLAIDRARANASLKRNRILQGGGVLSFRNGQRGEGGEGGGAAAAAAADQKQQQQELYLIFKKEWSREQEEEEARGLIRGEPGCESSSSSLDPVRFCLSR